MRVFGAGVGPPRYSPGLTGPRRPGGEPRVGGRALPVSERPPGVRFPVRAPWCGGADLQKCSVTPLDTPKFPRSRLGCHQLTSTRLRAILGLLLRSRRQALGQPVAVQRRLGGGTWPEPPLTFFCKRPESHCLQPPIHELLDIRVAEHFERDTAQMLASPLSSADQFSERKFPHDAAAPLACFFSSIFCRTAITFPALQPSRKRTCETWKCFSSQCPRRRSSSVPLNARHAARIFPSCAGVAMPGRLPARARPFIDRKPNRSSSAITASNPRSSRSAADRTPAVRSNSAR